MKPEDATDLLPEFVSSIDTMVGGRRKNEGPPLDLTSLVFTASNIHKKMKEKVIKGAMVTTANVVEGSISSRSNVYG